VGIEFYAFALFIAGLICLIAILCKVLFADLRRQHKLLDEKETKLLQLYRNVESIMEEFSDQAKATMEELKEYENRSAKRALSAAQPPEAVKKDKQNDKPSRSVTVDSSRIRAASEVLERAERIIKSDALRPPINSNNGAVFKMFFDETEAELSASEMEAKEKKTRNEAILSLAAEGKTDAQIASELGITRNEVKLVIGLKKK